MSSDKPIKMDVLEDGVLVAAGPHWRRLFDDRFTPGDTVFIQPYEERSSRSHRHYFACIKAAWDSLSDEQLALYPTTEHLRKKALIWTGFSTERDFVCNSKAEAARFGAFIQPIDEYAVVLVKESVVKVYNAQSQSTKAMGKKTFQESKDKVLDWISGLIGVDKMTLIANAEEAK